MTIEEGIDLEGYPCWFVLDGANLIKIFSSLQEAQDFTNI